LDYLTRLIQIIKKSISWFFLKTINLLNLIKKTIGWIINLLYSRIVSWLHSEPKFYSQTKQEYTFLGAFCLSITLTSISAVLLGFIIYIAVMRVDSEIRTEFTTKKFIFTANSEIEFNSLKFQSLVVHEFSEITLYPLPIEENDHRFSSDVNLLKITPKKGESDNSYIDIKNIDDEYCGEYVLPKITFPKASEEQLHEYFISVISFIKQLKQKPCGKLTNFPIYNGNTITLEANPDNNGEFNILIDKDQSKVDFSPVLVSFEEAFQLNSESTEIIHGDVQLSTEEADLKMLLDEDKGSNITILGQSNKLQLRLRAFPEKSLTFFSPTNISIVTPRIFTYNEHNDQKESSLMIEGKIDYMDYPNIKPLSFKESDIIRFGKGGDLKIERIRFNPTSGIEVRLRGKPTELSINGNDRRLTFYRTAKESEFGGIAIDYIIWAIPLIIGIMGLILIDRVKIVNDLIRNKNFRRRSK